MATKDRTSLKNEFKNGNLATGERFADLIDSVKVVQLPVVDPQVLGSTSSFIDSISQDADGKITATKKNVVLNYVNIQDKPQINGHTLNGDMSLKELGIINQIQLNDGTAIYPDQDGNVKLPVIPQTTNTITPGSAFVPTADAVDEALEEQNLLVTKATPYTANQKHNASANINDRAADVADVTGEVKSFGYKVLNNALSFAEQVTATNTIYEIKDEFDLGGEWQEVNLSSEFIYQNSGYYLSTAMQLEANGTIQYEKGYWLVTMVDNNYIILGDDGSYTATDNITVYLASRNYNLKCRYSVDGGVTYNELTIGNTSRQDVYKKFYKGTITLAQGKALYIKGNITLFDNEMNSIQRGGVYVPTAAGQYYIASSFSGTTSVFISDLITIKNNSTLLFNGGRLKNGIIKTVRTEIESPKICFSNVFLTKDSNFTNDQIRTSWFFKEGEDATDVLPTLFDIRCKVVLIDNRLLLANAPLEIRGHSRKIIGAGTYSSTATGRLISDAASIAADEENWDSSGYEFNALIWITGPQQYCEIKNLNLLGTSKDSDVYRGVYPVDFGIYYSSVFHGTISNLSFEQFAVAALRITGVEQANISRIRCKLCGAFVISTTSYINKYNPLCVGSASYAEGSNGVAMLSISYVYSTFTNFGLLVNATTDAHISKCSISHTSIGCIYTERTEEILSVIQNYFEGCGKSSFWIDENGLQGEINPNPENATMCTYLSNPHRDENGDWVQSGWGKSINGDKIRALLNTTTPIYINRGQIDIRDNYFSFRYIRSGINAGLNLGNVSICGLDAIVFTGSAATNISNSSNYFNFDAPYYLIVNNCSHSYNQMRIMVELPNAYYKKHANWFRTRSYNYTNDIDIICNSELFNYKNPNTQILDVFIPTTINNAKQNINAVGEFVETLEKINFYKLPSFSNSEWPVAKGIGYIIPFSEIQESPRIYEVRIKNNSSTTNYSIFPTLFYKRSSGTAFTAVDTTKFPRTTTTLTKNSVVTLYFYISSDLFSYDDIDELRLRIANTGIPADADISISPLYGRFVGGKLSTEFPLGFDRYGYPKKGTTADRPIVSPNVDDVISYYDTDLHKNIYWDGTVWRDSNGEPVELQVSDTSVLIGATADRTKTVSVYYGGTTAPTITVLNADDTANTWLTAALVDNILTLTAAANRTSAPRGAKVLVTLGEELVIINVVQSY